jgi:hypothetical protein
MECLFIFLRRSLSTIYRERLFREFIALVTEEFQQEETFGLEVSEMEKKNAKKENLVIVYNLSFVLSYVSFFSSVLFFHMSLSISTHFCLILIFISLRCSPSSWMSARRRLRSSRMPQCRSASTPTRIWPPLCACSAPSVVFASSDRSACLW